MRRPRRLSARPLALLLAVAAVTASSASAAPSPGDYRNQANALCAKTYASVKAIALPSTAKQIGAYVKSVAALQRPFVKAFAKLNPPGSLRSLHDRAVSVNKQDLANTEELLRMLADGTDPETAINEVSKKEDPLTKIEAATYAKLGLPACVALVKS